MKTAGRCSHEVIHTVSTLNVDLVFLEETRRKVIGLGPVNAEMFSLVLLV